MTPVNYLVNILEALKSSHVQELLGNLAFMKAILIMRLLLASTHEPRTAGEEIAFTAWLKIKSQSQILRYGPHQIERLE